MLTCTTCGHDYLPPKCICPECDSGCEHEDWTDLTKKGDVRERIDEDAQRIATLEAELAALENGCRDHGCIICQPTGQGTNGGCRCGKSKLRLRIRKLESELAKAKAANQELVEALRFKTQVEIQTNGKLCDEDCIGYTETPYCMVYRSEIIFDTDARGFARCIACLDAERSAKDLTQ